MDAREIMTQPVVTVRPETSLIEVAQTMVDHRIGCVPVTDAQGRLRGIVTLTDFAAKKCGVPFSIENLPRIFNRLLPWEAIERVREEARTTTAREILITEVITAAEGTPVGEVAKQMLRYDIDHIPVVREGVPVGIVSRHDLLRMIVRQAGAT
jgi:CBS domain-containing protein